MKRAAFTLVEMVFSLVVVGIVILSIPLIIKQSNENVLAAQNVFGYYNALTLMELISKKPWDDNNVEDFERSGEYYILYTGNDDTDCENTTGTNIWTKKGLAISNRRRMCDPFQKTASQIPNSYNNDLDSINAFNNYSTTITSTDSGGGTNNRFTLTSTIRYVDVDFGNGTNAGSILDTSQYTDVKEISVSLLRVYPDNSTETISTYVYYAANIGNDIPYAKDNE